MLCRKPNVSFSFAKIRNNLITNSSLSSCFVFPQYLLMANKAINDYLYGQDHKKNLWSWSVT